MLDLKIYEELRAITNSSAIMPKKKQKCSKKHGFPFNRVIFDLNKSVIQMHYQDHGKAKDSNLGKYALLSSWEQIFRQKAENQFYSRIWIDSITQDI
jgi:hypothetical protein